MEPACFHCGLPVPAPGGKFCCPGCEAVSSTILAAGLGRYYELRTAPAPLPAAGEPYIGEFRGEEASLVLEGVRCAACTWLIEQALRRHPGVKRAEVNYVTHRAHVAWDASQTGLAEVLAAVSAVGYRAFPYEPRLQDELDLRERRTALWRLFVAGFGAMQVMMYAFPAYFGAADLSAEAASMMRWASLALTVPVLAFSCAPFFAGARRELALRRLGLDTPIALGLAGGFAASAWATLAGTGEVYFDSISMLAFLLLGARFVEGEARRRAARMLDPLLRLDAARKVLVGETVVVAPGERVPADGVVLEGRSSADESLLTGESRPVAKAPGDALIAGSVNLEQPLRMRATHVGGQTRAAGIARLAERGMASKPRLVEAADRVARHLTPAILAAAALAGLFSADPWVAVAVLVVACPCALALAAPVVLTRASGMLLAQGVLLTRGAALEALARASDVVLDKTGTLTTGRLSIARAHLYGRLSQDGALEIARALEASSRHPIASAFADGRLEARALRHVAGQGIEGEVHGVRLRIGSLAFCRELCGALPPATAVPAARTAVYLADATGWLALFELEDELRPGAAQLVRALHESGVTVHLASGDRVEAAAAMAWRLGIRAFNGAMAPEEKLEYVAHLQRAGRTVVMVGDGLNDAPVLARADASFALAGGSDAAQLRSDVVLLGGGLAGVGTVLQTARGAMRRVRQNLAWALGYNALALPLAVLGFIGPWEAAVAMGASSATVLLNALRPLGPRNPWKASTSSFPSPSPSYS